MECPFVYVSNKHSQEEAAQLKRLHQQNSELEGQMKKRAKTLEAAGTRYKSLRRKCEGRRSAVDALKEEAKQAAETARSVKELEAQLDAERSKVNANSDGCRMVRMVAGVTTIRLISEEEPHLAADLAEQRP